MPNELDERTPQLLNDGNNINVIAKQLPIKVGLGSKLFEIALWLFVIPGIVLTILTLINYVFIDIAIDLIIFVAGLLPGIIYTIKKIKAGNYLSQIQQKVQHNASQVDNYLEQRVQILKNTANLVEKAITLDKETLTSITSLRSNNKTSFTDEERNQIASDINRASRNIKIAFENYPELRAHESIQKAMSENSYLQKEITAAREVYNDSVLRWNTAIYEWPCNMIVAAKRGYTTRIPFTLDMDTKNQARSIFFDKKQE